MPGLVFARRRMLLGGDEITVPYATCACGRTAWMLFLCIALACCTNLFFTTDCMRTLVTLFSYESASILVGVMSLVVEFQIARASMHGTIIDPGPRNKLLEKHLTRKSVLGAVQLLLALVGVVLLIIISLVFYCTGAMAIALTGISLTMVSQFLDAGGMYCCFLTFTSADDPWNRDDDEDEDEEQAFPRGVMDKMEGRYEDWCRKFCKYVTWCSGSCLCSVNAMGGEEGMQEADFAHVSRVFSRVLSANQYVDVVPTDIAAGLILLRHVQKSEDYKRRDELRGGSGTPSYSTLAKDLSFKAPKGIGFEVGDSRGIDFSAVEAGLVNDDRNSTSRRTSSGRFQSWRAKGRISYPQHVPLHERPYKHRKYYKVNKDERLMNLEHGGEDLAVLEEIAHFMRFSNIMYSVWSTVAVDADMGLQRIIQRSGSWCPRFNKKKDSPSRVSLYKSIKISRGSSVAGSDRPFHGGTGGGGSSDIGTGSRDDPRRPLSSAMEGNFRGAEIRGDDWRGSHETALRAELPEGTELVLAHFDNCLEETPYCVVLDHNWQSVIIAIRGSHSIEDFLVDAMAEPKSLEAAGREWGFDGRGMLAHEGMLQRAEWIRRDLEESGVLRLLLGEGAGRSGGDVESASRDSAVGDSWRPKGRRGSSDRFDPEGGMPPSVPLASAVKGSGFCAGYTLRLVGHSLGGGCAALLTLFLKSMFPSVKAFAVSPPGGLVSEGACIEAIEPMVTSLVLNDDVVPRLSSQSISALVEKLLDVLGRSRVSKLVVVRSLLREDEDAHRPEQYLDLEGFTWTDSSLGWGGMQEQPPVALVVNEDGRSEVSEAETKERQDTADEAGRQARSRYNRQLSRYREHLRRDHGTRRHLYRLRPPGRILRLVNTDFVREEVDVGVCEDGCLAFCCRCLVPRSRHDGGKTCCCATGRSMKKRRIFTPVWSSVNDLADIRVGPAFLIDHRPDEVLTALEQMLEDLGVSV